MFDHCNRLTIERVLRGVGIVELETNFALLEYQSLDYHNMYDRLRA
jgi:hypothetical protein